jgi:hypothetical protein
MTGKPSCPVRREAARKRTCHGQAPRRAADPTAWVMHARRRARDYERLVQHSESLITWAAITLMTRRITRRNSRRSGQPASREAQRD